MKKMIKITLLATALLTSAWALSSCSDWVDPESLNLHVPSFEEQNPGLYADYLADLKQYKASDHKLTFASFDNRTGDPVKQAERLSVLPDSLDFISLINPDNLYPDVLKEIEMVRAKGTRMIYSVDYSIIEKEWIDLLKKEENANLTEEDAKAFIAKRTEEMLTFCDKYHYDGVTISYPGRSLVSLPAAELLLYSARQKTFFDVALAWYETHAGKIFSFEGNPQFLVQENMDILTKCQYVILMTTSSKNTSEMDIAGNQAVVSTGELLNGAKFIVSVETTRPGDPNGVHGYFGTIDENGNKVRSAQETARWIRRSSGVFDRSGIFVTNAQYDYYDNKSIYHNIREAIGIMNPSPKK